VQIFHCIVFVLYCIVIQAERNEKALKRIQKMMRARSTLDWSRSNNIFLLKW